jgi:hypothetical protein
MKPPDRKPGVLGAISLLRPVFRTRGYDLTPYSNDAIADALLATCPAATPGWLSQEHLRRAVQRLQTGDEGAGKE